MKKKRQLILLKKNLKAPPGHWLVLTLKDRKATVIDVSEVEDLPIGIYENVCSVQLCTQLEGYTLWLAKFMEGEAKVTNIHVHGCRYGTVLQATPDISLHKDCFLDG